MYVQHGCCECRERELRRRKFRIWGYTWSHQLITRARALASPIGTMVSFGLTGDVKNYKNYFYLYPFIGDVLLYFMKEPVQIDKHPQVLARFADAGRLGA